MRILLVTDYPPPRDALTDDALEMVRTLRAQGHHLEVVSPNPSAAEHHLDLRSRRGQLALGTARSPSRPGRRAGDRRTRRAAHRDPSRVARRG